MGRPAFTNASRRGLDPERTLAVLASLFALAQLTEAALVDDPGVRAVTMVFALLTPVPLVFAWRAPLASLLAVDLLFLLDAILGGRLLDSSQVAVFLCVIGVFLVGLRAPTRDLAIGAAAATGLLTATSLLEGAPGDVLSGIAWVAIVPVGIPALAGRVLRSRNALNRRLDEQAREIEGNRAEREAGGGARRAHPDRTRAARRRRPRRLGHARPGRRRQAHRAGRPRARPRARSPPSRTPAARRSASCAACSASCAAATRSSRWRRSPRWRASARSSRACARPGCPSSSRWPAIPSICRPASTPPPFASSRRRSSTSCATRRPPARSCASTTSPRPSSSWSATTVAATTARSATAAGSSTCASASRSTAASCAPTAAGRRLRAARAAAHRGAGDVTLPRPRRIDLALAAALGVVIELEMAFSPGARDAARAGAAAGRGPGRERWRGAAPRRSRRWARSAVAAVGARAGGHAPRGPRVHLDPRRDPLVRHRARTCRAAGRRPDSPACSRWSSSSRRSAPTERPATSSSPSCSSRAAGRWAASAAAARA